LIYFFFKKKDAGRGKKGSHGSTSITHGQEQQTNNSLEELSCCWQKRGGLGCLVIWASAAVGNSSTGKPVPPEKRTRHKEKDEY
jgi:hypothetical protein